MKNEILKACKGRKIRVMIATNVWVKTTRKELSKALTEINKQNLLLDQYKQVSYTLIGDELIYIDIKIKFKTN